MLIGIIFATVVAYGLLRLIYRKMQDLENKDPIEISGKSCRCKSNPFHLYKYREFWGVCFIFIAFSKKIMKTKRKAHTDAVCCNLEIVHNRVEDDMPEPENTNFELEDGHANRTTN